MRLSLLDGVRRTDVGSRRAQRKAARVNGSFGELMRSLVAFIDEWIAGDLEEEKAVSRLEGRRKRADSGRR